MRKLLALLILLVAPAWAETYYVDNCDVTGNDGNNGTSTSTPWLTINKVNISSFSAGDSILFKKGCTWREQLTVPSSGSAGNPITFGAYGAGANPIISAADVLSSWTPEAVESGDLTGDANMQAYWYFEESSGTRYDETAKNNDLSVVNTPTQTSTHKQGSYALQTDATNYVRATYASLSADFPAKGATTAFSVGGWVQFPVAVPADWIVRFTDGGSGWALYIGSAHPDFRIWSPQKSVVASDTTMTTATWYHVVGTWDGSTLRFYVNGVADSHTTAATVLTAMYTDYLQFYNGCIFDEWFVMDRTLTPTEILGIYNDGLDGSTPYNIYYASEAFTPTQAFSDGSRLTKIATKAELTTGEWWWDAGNTRVYVFDDPSGNTIEASVRDRAIDIANQSYLGFDSFTVGWGRQSGVNIGGTSSDLTFSNILSEYNYWDGFRSYAVDTDTVDNVTVDSCEFAYNVLSGLQIMGAADTWHVFRSESHNNVLPPYPVQYQGGFRAIGTEGKTPSNILIEYCVAHDIGTNPSGGGIWFDTVGSGCIMRYNRSYSNTDRGLLVEISTGVVVHGNISYDNNIGIAVYNDCHSNLIYNNTIYNSAAVEMYLLGSGAAANFTNNIFKNNIATGTGLILSCSDGAENDGTKGSGNIYDHNCFGAEAANFITWGAATPDTYDAWETAYGGTTNSVEADPLFTNAAGGDFTLQAGSPCIEKGANVGTTYLEQLLAGSSWPDSVETADWHKTGGAPDVGAYGYRKLIW